MPVCVGARAVCSRPGALCWQGGGGTSGHTMGRCLAGGGGGFKAGAHLCRSQVGGGGGLDGGGRGPQKFHGLHTKLESWPLAPSLGHIWSGPPQHFGPPGGGGGWGAGVWDKASVSDWLPLAAPVGLSPLLILTLCGSERVLIVPTEPPDDLSCLTTPGIGRPGDGLLPVLLTRCLGWGGGGVGVGV